MMRLSPRKVSAYHKQIEKLEAHEDLRALTVALTAARSSPNDIRETIRRFQQTISDRQTYSRVITLEDIAHEQQRN